MNTANIITMLVFGFPQLLVRETAALKENNLEIAKLYSLVLNLFKDFYSLVLQYIF